jgi:hypothetical protein
MIFISFHCLRTHRRRKLGQTEVFDHSSYKTTDWEYTHTIQESDAIKIISCIKAAAALEAARGCWPANIPRSANVKLMEEFGNVVGSAIEAAGGQSNDQSWREWLMSRRALFGRIRGKSDEDTEDPRQDPTK